MFEMEGKSVRMLQERDKLTTVNNDASTPDEETIDVSLHRLRQELDTLRAKRSKEAMECRRDELKRLECLFRKSKERLRGNLSERSNQATYRRFLQDHQLQQHVHSDSNEREKNIRSSNSYVIPTSNYIILQETPLLSTMHRSFCVLPHQIEVMEQEYERAIYPYFRKEIQNLQLESLQVSSDWMSCLSLLAEENNALYDSYQNKLYDIEKEVRKHKKQLITQRSIGTTNKYLTNEEDEDETSIISFTERSTDCEDDDSEHIISPKEGGTGGFLKVAWLFRTPAPATATTTITPTTVKTASSSSSSMVSLSDSIHGKSGVVLQIAAKKFQLPFT